MGVQGAQVEEVYSLDDASLQELKPIYGLIFLFKWQSSSHTADSADTLTDGQGDPDQSHIFFAKQMINNACATQAILSILMNTPDVELGPELNQFKEFTQDFSPELKGLAISNSEVIRTVHNSFARSEVFANEEPTPATEKDDVFHFVSYVPIAGCLYELDGLKETPINLGPCTDQDWLQRVRPIIQQRMNAYSSSEIRFNLMAVIQNRKSLYTQRMQVIEREINNIQVKIANLKLGGQSPATPETLNPVDSKLGNSPSVSSSTEPIAEPGLPKDEHYIENLHAQMIALEDDLSTLRHKIDLEQSKIERYKSENVLRRHNFIPLVYHLVRQLVKKRDLDELINDAKLRKRRRME
ncbi:hypothetical protein IWQ62_000623 [Dispira parvispora]|uniref:Ubiquitin carboxyl-terminal hydrolase n=1 Tax=Dispira parvispora TaxID=1520584 RepID=A0A9W8AVI4_9FUNG|nr:hypothetical protein IWQ62_000623 [Dispira parvispora]